MRIHPYLPYCLDLGNEAHLRPSKNLKVCVCYGTVQYSSVCIINLRTHSKMYVYNGKLSIFRIRLRILRY